jgi:hypothetical protein
MSNGGAAKARDALNVPAVNWLDNPNGGVYQRSVASTADDAYMEDRWYALTQTGSITPSQLSNPEDGYPYAIRITQSQASAQRMGEATILEGKETRKLRGKTVTFGGRFKLSTASNLRLAILAWTSTEDSVTSDVVNDWTSSSYAAGGFFLAANLTVVAVSSTPLVAATVANAVVTGTIPATANNIVCIYWTESTAAQNVTLDAWGRRLVEASSLVDYVRRVEAEELIRCQRFVSTGAALFIGSAAAANNTIGAFIKFPVTMRAAPTIVLGTATENVNAGTILASPVSVDGFRLHQNTNPASGSVYYTNIYFALADL